jgi:integration host factor subunit beta
MAKKCLTRQGLINRLIDKIDMDPHKSKEASAIVINAMIKSLTNNHRIEIRKFGSFDIHTRTAKYARNLKTGEKILIGKQYSTHFKTGEPLRNRINYKSKN